MCVAEAENEIHYRVFQKSWGETKQSTIFIYDD